MISAITIVSKRRIALFLQRYPDVSPATADWEFMPGKHLASWMSENGPKLYYFFFCDPTDFALNRFSGIHAPVVRVARATFARPLP